MNGLSVDHHIACGRECNEGQMAAGEDTLRELLSHIDSWKQRKAAKEGFLASLAPLFVLHHEK